MNIEDSVNTSLLETILSGENVKLCMIGKMYTIYTHEKITAESESLKECIEIQKKYVREDVGVLRYMFGKTLDESGKRAAQSLKDNPPSKDCKRVFNAYMKCLDSREFDVFHKLATIAFRDKNERSGYVLSNDELQLCEAVENENYMLAKEIVSEWAEDQ